MSRGLYLFSFLSLGLGLAGCLDPGEAMAAPGEAPARIAALTSRSSFVSAEIARWNAGLAPADRAEKFGLMAASANNFFRGTDHLFWADHANHPDLFDYGADIFIAGDLHVSNLGAYNDDRAAVVFGMNDFDQAVIADYQLDVWRLATSLVLTGRADGLSAAKIREAVDLFSEAYLDQLDDDRKNNDEATRTFTAETTTGPIHDLLVSAGGHTRADLLARWTKVTGGTRAFDLSSADLAAVSAATRAAVVAALPAYRTTLHTPLPAAQFAVKSVVQRLHAGLGSLGLARYYVLIEGPSSSNSDDVILDIKTQAAPYAQAFTATPVFASEGERVATAQRALNVRVDDYLGWTQLGGSSFVVRAISPSKDALEDSHYRKAADFKSVAQQLGIVVATFHARADRDFRSDLVGHDFEATVHQWTNGQHDEFRALVWAHASSYASQVAADWAAFTAAPPL
jgi:uncharacterized protein (DUF2252 family)